MNHESHNTYHVSRIRQQGFTLIEVIMSVGIFTLILSGVIVLVASILNNSNKQSNLLANNDSARRAVFTLMAELRNATTSATGAFALNTAQDQQIIFFTKTSTSVDRVRYFLQSGVLYKGVTKPSGAPLTYNIAEEVVTELQKKVANGANPLFYYYDSAYIGSGASLTQPVNVTDVTFVKVNLAIFKNLSVTGSATYTVTAGGAIRNLKTNLGS